jgi:hypothetical protein
VMSRVQERESKSCKEDVNMESMYCTKKITKVLRSLGVQALISLDATSHGL